MRNGSTSLRLGFHYHVPARMRDGAIHMPGYLGRFLEELGKHCAEVVCFQHTPSAAEEKLLDYRLCAPNIRLVDIGPHCSIPKRMLTAGYSARFVWEERKNLDALLIRGPSPLLPAMARAAGNVPVALLLVGDYVAGVDDLPQPRWRKELIRLWSRWNQHAQNRVAKRSLTFVNSRALFEKMQPIAPNLVETRTTTLNAADFYEREDTCQSAPYRLLYTGRLDRAKGLMEAVQALEMLVESGEDVVFDLVGWAEKGDNILEEITAFARSKGIAERIRNHGLKKVGPELFAYYRQADIFVLPSYNEGFPRVIWEAMAHSLPVVATKVGSIPHFVGDAVELIEPRDAGLLAQAVSRLVHDPYRRHECISRGMTLARENTQERVVHFMIKHIQEWVQKQ